LPDALMSRPGGLGIPYTDEEKPLDLEATARGVARIVKDRCRQFGLREPRVVMEPARYFVGDAGYLIGRVHNIWQSGN
jgi:diaminopimelate decarboxylase